MKIARLVLALLAVSLQAPLPITVDAPNTHRVKAGERVGLSIAPDTVRLLPADT